MGVEGRLRRHRELSAPAATPRSGNGTHRLSHRVQDGVAGRNGSTTSCAIDATVPVNTTIPTPTDWQQGPVAVDVTGTDAISIVHREWRDGGRRVHRRAGRDRHRHGHAPAPRARGRRRRQPHGAQRRCADRQHAPGRRHRSAGRLAAPITVMSASRARMSTPASATSSGSSTVAAAPAAAGTVASTSASTAAQSDADHRRRRQRDRVGDHIRPGRHRGPGRHDHGPVRLGDRRRRGRSTSPATDTAARASSGSSGSSTAVQSGDVVGADPSRSRSAATACTARDPAHRRPGQFRLAHAVRPHRHHPSDRQYDRRGGLAAARLPRRHRRAARTRTRGSSGVEWRLDGGDIGQLRRQLRIVPSPATVCTRSRPGSSTTPATASEWKAHTISST